MSSLPLHPVLVHVPLALAVLMPLVAVGFAWALWTGRIHPRRGWLAVVALQALLVGSAYAAVRTGEAEEDRVEAVVQRSAVHEHEERAEQFVTGSAVALGLTVLVAAFRRPGAARALAAASAVATLAAAGLAVRVGHSGGELVYVHGAANAYIEKAPAAAGAGRSAPRPAAPDNGNDSD